MNERTGRMLMSAVDRAWLEMDQPGNPMVIGALFQLEGPVDAAALQRELVERLLRYPRFCQAAVLVGGQQCWCDGAELDYRYHVQVRRLSERDFERRLRKSVSGEMSRDLDRARPLWRLILFPRPGGPVTVLFRVHHALADGIALVTLLLDSTDSGLSRGRPRPAAGGRHPHGGLLGGLIDRLESLNRGLERFASLKAELRQPRRLLRRVHEGRAAVGAIGRLLRLPDNRPPALARPLSGHREVAWLGGLPFAPIRRLAHRLDVRVNDLFMAALAGALGRQLRQDAADPLPHMDLRVSIPVNLRQGRGRELGNQFGLVLLDLPVGIHDPAERLRLVAGRMAALKTSLEARATLLGLAAAGHLPVPLERRLVGLIGAKAAAVVSNLPGPLRQVRIAGARLKSLVFWPPQAGGMGLGLSFFTYAGALNVGVSADRALLPNPQALLQALRDELEGMADLAAAGPGPAPGRESRPDRLTCVNEAADAAP
jgi:WS/DGAT/MGAT family acyltransferase